MVVIVEHFPSWCDFQKSPDWQVFAFCCPDQIVPRDTIQNYAFQNHGNENKS